MAAHISIDDLARAIKPLWLLPATDSKNLREITRIESSYTLALDDLPSGPLLHDTMMIHFGPLSEEDLARYRSLNLAALATDQRLGPEAKMTIFGVANTFEAFGLALSALHQNPSAALRVTAITGTNGKTTTSFLLDSILRAAGRKTALFGSLEYRLDQTVLLRFGDEGHHTTPGAHTLQPLLTRARDAGITDVVLEASSEGLSEYDLAGTDLTCAAFLNCSPEHLESHGTFANYFRAKASLFFANLAFSQSPKRIAVLNFDDRKIRDLAHTNNRSGIDWKGFSTRKDRNADVLLLRVKNISGGLQVTLRFRGSADLVLVSPLRGPFHAKNILAASTIAYALGCSFDEISKGIATLTRVPGRYEVVPNSLGLHLLIDWAHSISAYEVLLRATRKSSSKRLLLVFGLEDKMPSEKRRAISELGARYTDARFVTLEGLSKRDAPIVRAEMQKGFGRKKATWYRSLEPALRAAVRAAKPGDTILLVGSSPTIFEMAPAWLSSLRPRRN